MSFGKHFLCNSRSTFEKNPTEPLQNPLQGYTMHVYIYTHTYVYLHACIYVYVYSWGF